MARWNEYEETLADYDAVPSETPEKGAAAELAAAPLKDTNAVFLEIKPQKLDLAVLKSNIGNCLEIIDDEVMKGYITRLTEMPIIDIDNKDMQNIGQTYFFKITKLVYEQDEFSVHKLATVFHSLSNKPCTLAMMIKSDGDTTDFYLGVRSRNSQNDTGTMREMLQNGLLGQFPGSCAEQFTNEDLNKELEKVNAGSISCVTCVADFKQNKNSVKNQDFIQGLEKYVYSMKGKRYTAVFIADNLSNYSLMDIKQEYENIYTQLSPFANMQFNITNSTGSSSSEGKSFGQTRSETNGKNTSVGTSKGYSQSSTVGESTSSGRTDTSGKSSSVSDGTSHTKGVSDGVTHSVSDAHTDGKSKGVSVGGSLGSSVTGSVGGAISLGINAIVSGSLAATAGLAVGLTSAVNASVNSSRFSSDTHTVSDGTTHTESFSDSISKTLTNGVSSSHSASLTDSKSKSSTDTDTFSKNEQSGTNYSISDSFNFVNSNTLSSTLGETKGITLNAKNKTMESILNRIEKHLQRFDECESIGMWNCAAYFLGETKGDTEIAANTYQSLMSGLQSGIERSAVNTWVRKNDRNEESAEPVMVLQKYIKKFVHPQFLYQGVQTYSIVNPSTLVSTNELALHFGLPTKSVKGLPVINHATFGQEVLRDRENDIGDISFGKIYHLGAETKTDVDLHKDSFTMHTFVTGSTGSGKSNAVYNLLSKFQKSKVPFLVVEPAKGEYKNVFSDVNVFGTNSRLGAILKINPFSFPEEVHVLEHIDRLVEIFNVCWPMYAAMPAVLKDAVENAYKSIGWDLPLSVNTKVSGLYPTFEDVTDSLRSIINSSDYSGDTKSDYIGSLATRLKSLTNGINGMIFSGEEIPYTKLFDENTIIDISRVGSMETKSLIMGIIVLKLQEYRMSSVSEMNSSLQHITVLEEAHNLLKRTSSEQSQESSNVQGKSVEMLTNAIAEMRTYGEGFIIVDQAPNLLDTAVIRNTNTKIVMRLPEGTDRDITGKAMALNDKQIEELSKLPTGIAAVYQNDWQEAVLCSIPKFVSRSNKKGNNLQVPLYTYNNADILHGILSKDIDLEELRKLKEDILKLNISAKLKADLVCNIESRNLTFEWAAADFINKCFDCSNVFRGTDNTWDSYDELYQIAKDNISNVFIGFDEEELRMILYFICHIQHEMYPANDVIEQFRVEYLKGGMTNARSIVS